jgi:beta-glucanase (GH16 family)
MRKPELMNARRLVTAVALLCLMAASAAVAVAHPTPAGLFNAKKHHKKPATATATASDPVSEAGTYLVSLSVLSHKKTENVTVYLTGQAKRSVHAKKGKPAHVSYNLTLGASTPELTARAVSRRPKVRLSMTLKLLAAAATPTPTPTPTPPPTPTGPTYIGQGGFNTLAYSSNFSMIDSSGEYGWTKETDPGECGSPILNYNEPSAVTVDGSGNLDITATAGSSQPGDQYTSGQLFSNFSFEYGAVEATIKLPPGEGLCSAFWMKGQQTGGNPLAGPPIDDNTYGGNTPPASSTCYTEGEMGEPECGELDVLEAPAFGQGPQNPGNALDPFYAIFTLHGDAPTSNYQQFETNTTQIWDPSTSSDVPLDLASGFHTYGIVWTPNSIIWTIDGYEYASTSPTSAGFNGTWDYNDRDFNLLLDLAVGGWPCNAPNSGNCPSTSSFPAQMVVQSVKVYQ